MLQTTILAATQLSIIPSQPHVRASYTKHTRNTQATLTHQTPMNDTAIDGSYDIKYLLPPQGQRIHVHKCPCVDRGVWMACLMELPHTM